MKELEQKALQLLNGLGFNIVGYYPYDSVIDIVAYLEPRAPFRNKTKVIVEIRTDEPTPENIDGFFKLGKNTLVEKMILFTVEQFEKLTREVQSLISKSKIEYFDERTLDKILEEAKAKTLDISQLTNACDVFSAKRLSEALPDLARQITPNDIRSYFPQRQAWEILEDAVFAIFNFCFGYETRQLGSQSLFEHEPEGMVVCSSKSGGHFGLIYDCKSSKSSYKMTKQDELTYIDYIKKKKIEMRSLCNCELQYFLIISPKFSGDLDKRRDAVYKATSILLFFIEAMTLRDVALWAFKLPNKLKPLIDISEFLLPREIIVSDKTVAKYIQDFNKRQRTRY